MMNPDVVRSMSNICEYIFRDMFENSSTLCELDESQVTFLLDLNNAIAHYIEKRRICND